MRKATSRAVSIALGGCRRASSLSLLSEVGAALATGGAGGGVGSALVVASGGGAEGGGSASATAGGLTLGGGAGRLLAHASKSKPRPTGHAQSCFRERVMASPSRTEARPHCWTHV